MHRRSFLAGAGALWLPTMARAQAPLAVGAVRAGRGLRASVGNGHRALDASHGGGSVSGPGRRRSRCNGRSPRTSGCRRSCGRARPRPSASWATRCMSRSSGLQPGRPYWYRFTLRRRGQPGRPHPHRAGAATRMPAAARSPSPRASTTSTATSPRYRHIGGGGARRWCCSSATTSTRLVGPRRWCVRHAHAADEPTTLADYRDALRAVQVRPRPAGGARRRTLDRHLGRPRGRQRLRRRHRAARSRSRALPARSAPRPTRPTTSTCRCRTAMQPRRTVDCGSTTAIAAGELAELPCARRPPVPLAPCLPRPLTRGKLAARTAPSGSIPARTHAGRRAGGVARATACAAPRRAGTCRPADADGRARPRRRTGSTATGPTAGTAIPPARRRLLDAVAASPVRDTLVLGGDVHSFFAADLERDRRPRSSPPSSSAARSPRRDRPRRA